MADIQHKNITGLDAAHPPFYASESDPTTTLGPYRGWIKPLSGEVRIRNATNTGWILISSGSASSNTAWDPVRVAPTTNVTISSPGSSFDGVTLSGGDVNKRVLLANQSTSSQNGIYDWNGAASAMTRATDADAASEFTRGKVVAVIEGTINGGMIWQLVSEVTTLGTSNVTIFQTVALSYITFLLDVTIGNSTALADGDILTYNDGAGVWENAPPSGGGSWSSVVGTGDTSTSTTLANLSGLSFSVAASGVYIFDALLFYDSGATTTGAKFTLTGPSSPTALHYSVRQTLSASTAQTQSLSTYDSAAATTTSLVTGNVCQIQGRIEPSVSGTVQLRFATEIAGSAITVYSESLLQWLQVA